MRKYSTDYHLWGLIAGGLFAPIAIATVVMDGIAATMGMLERQFSDVCVFVFACGIVGWVLHAAAVVCGVRLSGRPDPPVSADYDDLHPPPAG